MRKVTFVVKTRAPDRLPRSPTKRGVDDLDVSLEFGPTRHAPGISTTEVLINVAISLGSGVPAGIAANWLFVKLGLGRDTRLYDQTGDLLATVKEIEAKLEVLSKQAPTEPTDGESAHPPI